MQHEHFIINKIKEKGVLPLFYHDEAGICLAVTKALYEADVLTIIRAVRKKI